MIVRPRRYLMFDGASLRILMNDDNQMRMFLILATYCDLMIGSNVQPELKGKLGKQLINYQRVGRDSNNAYVLGLIGSPEDLYLIEKESTDISIALMNAFNSKAIQTEADITMNHFYGLTYILLKHGSQL